MSFGQDGAQLFSRALSEVDLMTLEIVLAAFDLGSPGIRLGDAPGLAGCLSVGGPVGMIAASVLGKSARPVRAVLFDKSPEVNWSLGWHQDRTIVVERRVETPGFGPWSTKAGLQHVEPPFDILEGMVTVRIHLDPAGQDNAPLLVAPGSQRSGRIPEAAISSVVDRCGQFQCLAQRGDVWLYATAVLHASEASRSQSRRRVLQVDYASGDLPGELRWRGL